MNVVRKASNIFRVWQKKRHENKKKTEEQTIHNTQHILIFLSFSLSLSLSLSLESVSHSFARVVECFK